MSAKAKTRLAALVAGIGLLVGAGLLVWTGPSGGAAPVETEPGADRVLLVTAPRLTWERMDAKAAPTLWAFAGEALRSMLSVRTIGSVTGPHEAYLTIGAGIRSGGEMAPDQDQWNTDGAVLGPEERYAGQPAADLYLQQTGESTGDAAAVSVQLPGILQTNEELKYGGVPGALAGALAANGATVGVVANADPGLGDEYARQAGLAAMDTLGQVDDGVLDRRLLTADKDSAFGVRLDPEVVRAATASSLQDNALTIVELSDLERAERASQDALKPWAERLRLAGLKHSDAVFKLVVNEVEIARRAGTRVTVLVVAPTAPFGETQLTVFALQPSAGEDGLAMSASTRRSGYVTLTDVASTVLNQLGFDVPKEIGNTPISKSGDSDWPQDARSFVSANERAVFVLRIHDGFSAFAVLSVVALVAAAAFIMWRRPSMIGSLELPAYFVAAVPTASYLMAYLRSLDGSTLGYVVAILGLAAVIAGGSHLLAGRDSVRTVVYLSLIGWVVFAGDVVTGARMQLDTVFGYSPIVAGRFAGFGNLAFAQFGFHSVVLATIGVSLLGANRSTDVDALDSGSARGTWKLAPALVAAVALASIIIDGAPKFGSDVGGVIAMVPVFALLVLHATGRRVRLRSAVLAGVAAFGVLAVFVAIDLAQPPERRTHLGRFALKVADGEAGEILQRKIQANLSILNSSVWALMLPAALLLVIAITVRPPQYLASLKRHVPGFRPFAVGSLGLAVAGMVVNDSGVAVPAVIFAVGLPAGVALIAAAPPTEDTDGPASTEVPARPEPPEVDTAERDTAPAAVDQSAGRA